MSEAEAVLAGWTLLAVLVAALITARARRR